MLEKIQDLDVGILEAFGSIHTPTLDAIMVFLTRLGDNGSVWILLTLCIVFLRSTRTIGFNMFLGLGLNLILGEGILKHLIERDRPFISHGAIELLIASPSTSSFPSGHTSTSWCFAFLFTYYFWSRSRVAVIFIWIVALGVTVSRLYLQVHYFTDILGGVLVGFVSSILVLFIIKRYKLYIEV